MLGLVVELAVSWLLLQLFARQRLEVLGFGPTRHRLTDLLAGLLIAAGCGTLYHAAFAEFAAVRWTLNPTFTAAALPLGAWTTLQSVLYEELLFRGALLHLLIGKIGVKAACGLSAACFGVYHWFTMNAWGNPLTMTMLLVMTGLWGLMFAVTFARTQALYLAVGLHFGWNFISAVGFSQGPLGRQLLVAAGGHKLGEMLSLAFFAFQVFAVPLLAFIYLKNRSATPSLSN